MCRRFGEPNCRARVCKTWCEDHKEMSRVRGRKYYRNNIGKVSGRLKKYYRINKNHILERCHEYYYNNNSERIEYSRTYRETHKEQIKKSLKKSLKKYRKTAKGKESMRRAYFKRRNLGFIPLNESFKDSDAHHIDRNYVIYIPRNIHKSVKHNLNDFISMSKINKIAFKYLDSRDELI